MLPNPVLKRLGFSDTDRVVILHTDDIGMCQASVAAYIDLWENGTISSGAVMVPCPWFLETAAYCRAHPGVDMGVHLTLNAEWDTYRWGPLSTRDSASGLIDDQGYFHQSALATQQTASPAAVQAEIQTQVSRALGAGIEITHIDTHMGTVAHPKFIQSYIELAFQHHLPLMVLRQDQTGYQAMGMDSETAAFAAVFAAQLEASGIPLIDRMVSLPLDQPENQVNLAKKLLNELPPGVTHFLFHPSVDTPELRKIAGDWPSRVANYHTFMSLELKEFIKNSGLQVIGYRALRELI